MEDRSPTFVEDDSGDKTAPSSITTSFGKGKYLWGNMPAIDVLRIERNEGRDFGGDLWLLFAGKCSKEMGHTSKRPTSLIL